MFTKAEEQAGGKKIAFESAAVNLRKDMQHLLHYFLVVFIKGKRLSVCVVFILLYLIDT